MVISVNASKQNALSVLKKVNTRTFPETESKGSITCGEIVNGNTTSGMDIYGYESPEHLYTLSIDEPKLVTFNTCGSEFDTYIFLFADDGAIVARNDDTTSCSLQSELTVPLPIGDFYIMIEGYGSGESGTYSMTMTCEAFPSELDTIGSIACGETKLGNTTSEDSKFYSESPEHIYDFVIYTTTDVVLDTCNFHPDNFFDTTIFIWDENLTMIPGGFSDDSTCSIFSKVTVTLEPGKHYALIEGYGDLSDGLYNLKMTCNIHSKSPSIIPAGLPSAYPSLSLSECKDSPSEFEVTGNNGQTKTRKCDWVKKKNYVKRCEREGVKDYCKETCGLCDRSDYPSLVPSSDPSDKCFKCTIRVNSAKCIAKHGTF